MMDSREAMMAADELFGELPAQSKPQAEAAPLGAPRLREPQGATPGCGGAGRLSMNLNPGCALSSL
jgi:hypothetical protein